MIYKGCHTVTPEINRNNFIANNMAIINAQQENTMYVLEFWRTHKDV
jgi:hypothetical protein